MGFDKWLIQEIGSYTGSIRVLHGRGFEPFSNASDGFGASKAGVRFWFRYTALRQLEDVRSGQTGAEGALGALAGSRKLRPWKTLCIFGFVSSKSPLTSAFPEYFSSVEIDFFALVNWSTRQGFRKFEKVSRLMYCIAACSRNESFHNRRCTNPLLRINIACPC